MASYRRLTRAFEAEVVEIGEAGGTDAKEDPGLLYVGSVDLSGYLHKAWTER